MPILQFNLLIIVENGENKFYFSIINGFSLINTPFPTVSEGGMLKYITWSENCLRYRDKSVRDKKQEIFCRFETL